MILVDIPAASRGTGVPEGTIRRWISEGGLESVGRRPQKVDLDEVIAIRDALGSQRNRATRKGRRLPT